MLFIFIGDAARFAGFLDGFVMGESRELIAGEIVVSLLRKFGENLGNQPGFGHFDVMLVGGNCVE